MADTTQATSENPILDSLAQKNVAPAQEAAASTEVENQEDNQENSSLSNKQSTENQEQQVNESENSNADDSLQAENQQNAEGEEKKPWWEEEDGGSAPIKEGGPVDYSSLGKSLGIDAKDEISFRGAVEKLKTERDAAQAALAQVNEKSPYANEQIQKANELAATGGDWKSFLQITETNWDTVDDQTLVVELDLKPTFGEDVAGMQDYISKLSPAEIKVKGTQIRRDLKANQEAEKQKLFADASAKKQKVDTGIREALDKTDSMYGVKLTPAKRKEIYDDITGNNFLNSIFYNKDGSVNPKGMTEVAFLVKNIKEVMKVNMTNSKNAGIKEVFKEATIPNTRPGGQMANPSAPVKSSPLGEHMDTLKKNGPQ